MGARRSTTNTRTLTGLAAILALVASFIVAQPSATAATPVGRQTAAQLNTAFNTYGDTSGRWSGADGTASVTLPDGRVAWLFSDTYIGPVNADHTRPASTPMINNSMVLQSGDGMESLYRGTTVAPSALMAPTAAGEFFWVGDGTVAGGKLRVAYQRYARSGQGSLDVSLQGTNLATFDLTTFALESAPALPVGSKIAWGVEMVEDGATTYVYGSEYVEETRMRFAHVARTSNDLSAAWEYWNGSGWVTSELASARLTSGVGTTFGVQRVAGGWALVTQQGHGIFSSDIVAYTATAPTGPFGEATHLYRAPEPTPGSEKIVYDVHVHPNLATPGKLLWSYNVNTLSETGNSQDARIYRPRFVETSWPVPAPDPSLVPAKVTGVGVTQNTDGQAVVTWAATPGATKYWLYQRNVTDGQTAFARNAEPLTTLSDVVPMVRHGKNYQFRVTAANATGEGPVSDSAGITMNVLPPAAPTGITATPDGTTGGVRVGWQGVAGAWNYEVFYRDTTVPDEGFEAATMAGPDARNLQVKNLNLGHLYEFYVIAKGAGGNSAQSALVTATPVGIPPATPASLTATATTTGSIRLAWTASTTPDVWYWVYQRDVTADEDFVRLPLPISTGTSMEAGYLADGHRYEFAVSAYGGGGESAKSPVAAAVSAYPQLGAPTGLTATAGNGEVVLKWTPLGADTWYWVHQRDVTAGETAFTKLPLPISSGSTMTAGYLSNGHTYEFRVSGIGPSGEGALSAVVSATPKFPPPAPVAGVTATAEADGDIAVKWTDRADTFFWIYQRDVTAGEAFRKLQYPSDKGSFTASGLKHGHVYEFKVQPHAYGVDGPISAVVRATSFYAKPPAPTGLVARAMGNATIRLDWNGPAGVTFWVYQRDVTAGEAAFTKLGLPSLDKTAELGLMKAGHKYEFKVAAENQGGLGALSAVASATSYGGLPGAPSGLTATALNKQVRLSWTGSSTAGVQYIVYQRDLTEGDPWQRLPLPITGTTMTAGYLANGHTYAFRVTAQNGIGESGGSNTVQSKPMPPFPVAPASLNASPENGAVSLSWSASATPEVLYWVEMRPAGGVWDRLPLPVSGTSLRVNLLRNAVTYEFRVRANNLSGTSSPSPVDTARPMPPAPTPPATLTATAGDRRVAIDWSASSVAGVYYWVEYRIAGKGWIRLPYPVVGQTHLTVLPLANKTRYEFRVLSANERGVSAPSPVAAATPIPPLPVAPSIWWTGEFNGGVDLSWSDNTIDPEQYEIRRVHGVTGVVRSHWTTDRKARLRIPVQEEYRFQVRSWNVRGWGPWSAAKSAVPRTTWYPFHTDRPGSDKVNALAESIVGGRNCKSTDRQNICFNTDLTLGQKRPMTLGDYLGYPNSEDVWDLKIKCEAQERAGLARALGTATALEKGPDLQRHEAAHSEQWARWGLEFGAMYGAADLIARRNGTQNKFEIDANLYHGSYWRHSATPEICPRKSAPEPVE
ncbi:fibronectin type III domain-containing protein [Kribbella deserti]|uniref:Fibronectin type III domain-containing protein n=1 Tax=Kribbella deserti TaxID=1926257 RepID=A0ABV6QKZ3_9ACTN